MRQVFILKRLWLAYDWLDDRVGIVFGVAVFPFKPSLNIGIAWPHGLPIIRVRIMRREKQCG